MPSDVQDPPPAEATPPRPRRRRRRWIIALVILIAGAWWLNGPGLRWIGSIVLDKVLTGASIDGHFRIEGTLSGGLSLHDIRLTSQGTLQRLEADEIAVGYRLTELVRGRIRSLHVDSLSAVLELEADQQPTPEKEPLDWDTLPDLLRTGLSTAHQHADPLDIRLDGIALELQRKGQPVFKLAPSRIVHRGSSAPIELEFGTITSTVADPIESRRFRIDWTPDKLEIAPFSPLTDWQVDDLTLDTRGGDTPLLATDVVVKNRRLAVLIASDLHSGSVQFTGEPLTCSELLADFGIETEFDFLLHQLELSFSGLGQPAADWQSQLGLELTNARWRDWQAQRFRISARQDGPAATANWQLDALDATASGSATASWPDAASLVEAPVPSTVSGTLQVGQLAALLSRLRQRFPIPTTDTPFPAGTLKADWSLEFADQKPQQGSARLALRAEDPDQAPPIDLDVEWTADNGSDADLAVPGIELKAELSPDWNRYDASLQLADNGITSIRRWLDPFYLVIPDGLSAAAAWQGQGSFSPGEHSGSLDLTKLTWSPADQPAIEANSRFEYRLPELALEVEHLHATRDALKLQLEGKLAAGQLELGSLAIQDGEGTLVSGSASSPLPADLADWRALFKSEDPWQLELGTGSLDLARINQLLPEDKALPATGTLDASVNISGSPANPQVQATLNGTQLQPTRENQSIPPTQLRLNLETREQRLEIKGILHAEGWPELTLRAGAPLSVGPWLENPDSLLDTPVDARAVLPPVDLARLITPPDSIHKLTGTLSADIGLAGTPRNPEFDGGASLREVEFKPADDRITSLSKGNLELDLKGTRITLARLEGDAAGGTINGSGSLDLADATNPLIDVRLGGSALPLFRDDSMILRANASLRLAGSRDDATLSGNIDLVQSLFFRDFELIPIGIPFTTPSAPSLPSIDPPARAATGPMVPPPFGDWKLDLVMRTDDPFQIHGNLAQGSITGEVRVGGTLGQPRPTGALELRKFEAELPLSRLKIARGKVIFRPDTPFEPALEIRGRSTLRPYEVNIFISGTSANPLITMSSNPPLPENEILTLLATGATSSQLENSNAAFTKFVQLLLEEARRGRLRYAKQLKPVLEILRNVDFRVGEIDPYTGRDFTSVTAPISDRWLTSFSFDDEGRNRAVLIFLTRFK